MKKIYLLLLSFSVTSLAVAQTSPWSTVGPNSIYNTNTGNVGIGTGSSNAPAYRLHVNGTIYSTGPASGRSSGASAGFRLQDVSQNSAYPDWYMYASNGLFYLSKGDYPNNLDSQYPGNVFQADANNGLNIYKNLLVNGAISAGGDMRLWAHEGEEVSGTAYVKGSNFTTGTSVDLQLSAQSTTGLVDVMRLNGNGKVGIGTTNPQANLQVNGDFRTVSGRFSSLFSTNTDGMFPTNYINEGGSSQLSLGANWVSGSSDLALINSNLASNGISFWQQTAATAKSLLVYFRKDGNVGIGTFDPGTYKLAVEGKIGAREIEVKTGSWSDFVFKADYNLPSLSSVESYIKQHNHLPNIPSEQEVLEKGIALGEMNARLLQKIEELTLYSIDQQKQIVSMQKELASLKKEVSTRKK